jgi:hypothetical protein
MRRLMVVCLVLLSVSALGAAFVSPGMALPSVLLLPGQTGSLLISSLTNTFKVRLETALGTTIAGEGLLMRLHFPNATNNLGASEVLALKMALGAEDCATEGDAEGEVLLPSMTFHLVYDSLTVLGVAALFLLPGEVLILCGMSDVKIKGSLLMLLTPIKTEVLETRELAGILHCKFGASGVPEDKRWWNQAGAVQNAQLLANFGAAFEEACVNLSFEVELKPSRMVEIMG